MKQVTAAHKSTVLSPQRPYRRPTLAKAQKLAELTAQDGKISGIN